MMERKLIDGSQLEGGGQLLRASMALCSILRQPIEVANIRAGRSKPGLAAQHLSGVNLVGKISGGTIEDACIGSARLRFTPSLEPLLPSVPRVIEDCGTAGSITLMAQSAIPAILFSTSRPLIPCVTLELMGGTNVSTSPPLDHLQHILIPLLQLMGINISIEVRRRGYYPVGGGHVILHIAPLAHTPVTATCGIWPDLRPLCLTQRGSIESLNAVVFGNAPESCLTAMCDSLRTNLAQLAVDIESVVDFTSTTEPAAASEEESLSPIQVKVDVADDIKSFLSRNHSVKRAKTTNGNKSKLTFSLGAQIWAQTSTGCRLSANVTIQSKKRPVSDDLPFSNEELILSASSVVSDLRRLLESKACIDEYTADQLVVFMSLSTGESTLLVEPVSEKSSLHLDTVMHICRSFLSCDIGFKALDDSGHADMQVTARIDPSAPGDTVGTLPSHCRIVHCRGLI